MAAIGNGDHPRRSRNAKRAIMACVGCKKSKPKCDIASHFSDSEGCTNCQERGEACEVRYGGDKRRKRSVPINNDLQTRLSALEDLLHRMNPDRYNELGNSYSGEYTTTSGFTGTIPADNGAGRGKNVAHSLAGQLISTPRAIMGEEKSKGSPMPLRSDTSDVLVPPTDKDQAHEASGIPNQRIERSGQASDNRDESHHEDVDHTPSSQNESMEDSSCTDDANNIIHKVISHEQCLNVERDDGHAYFGSTSIYHLSNPPEKNHFDKASTNTDSELANPDLDCCLEPEPIVSHLLNLFWTWQSSHVQVVPRMQFLAHKELYYLQAQAARSRHRYQFFSPCLLFAIMSLAVMISPHRGVRHHSKDVDGIAGDVYFGKAKRLFEQEIGHPCITTVQAALILGSRYGALGNHSLGWTYSGIALRMAVELGLHLKYKPVPSHDDCPDLKDLIKARSKVFWGCYVQDKLWSAYCGRPSILDDRNITLPLPDGSLLSKENLNQSEAILMKVHREIVRLTIHLSNILNKLYFPPHDGSGSDVHTTAVELHSELLQWHSQLPESLNWPNDSGSPSSGQVLLMHMQFSFALLLLHRPFINYNKFINTGSDPCIIDTTPICTLAATNIAKLARDYSLFYDIRKITSPAIHFIFIASTVHLINYQLTKQDVHQTWFEGCVSSLEDISKSYPAGAKAVSVLQDLFRQFEASERLDRQRGLSKSAENACSRVERSHSEPNLPDSHSSTVRSLNGLESTGFQHPKAPVQPLTRELDGLSATTNHGIGFGQFDWSGCNSPINPPPTLCDIDMESLQPMWNSDFNYGADPVFSSTMVSSAGNLGEPVGFNDWVNNQDTIVDATHPARVLFNRFYGTAFGWNQS